MSNEVAPNESPLMLLDVLGFPSEQMLFSPLYKSLIYSLGPNIIYYNLSTNSKTFVQYLSKEILLLKFLDQQEKLLLTIDKSEFPLICIWELPSFTQIYSQEITISSQNNYNISDIFLEQIYQEIYLIVLTSNIGINYLYILKNEYELNNNYTLDLFKKLSFIKEIIYDFKAFYNSKDIIFLLERNLLYYYIDLEKENYYEKMKIDFPFSLIPGSLRLSKDVNLVAFLTSKGNCLIYDQNGNNKPSINPFGQEYFTSCEFEGDSICLGTNHGKIYVYNIYENKPKFFIHYKAILRIKDNFQLNSTYDSIKRGNEYHKNNNFIKDLGQKINDSDEYNFGPEIKFICLNERIDQIFIRLGDNSLLLAPLSLLIDHLDYQNISYSNGNNIIFYAFNHSKNIDDIIINISQKNEYENNSNNSRDNNYNNTKNLNNNNLVIFSCSKDQKIIKYYIDYETNKLSNSFFNLKEILSNTQSQGRIIVNYNSSLNKNGNENMIFLTILKYHPLYSNKLFAGDNKGFLYLFDTKENKFQYKKPIIDTYSIVSLEFSIDGNLLCIGFDTGCQVLCNMKKDCEICLQLNSHYMPVEESEFRKINIQIICFSYFFKNIKKHNECILYTKSDYLLEYSQLFYDRNRLNKREIKTMKIMNKILDIKVHISENYVIILNNTNQILINHIFSGITTAVIDLNSRVKCANNIQVDNSGLFLGVICELYDGSNNINNLIYSKSKINNKRNYIIIFEIGTGKVKTCINYINPINKMLFDNKGNYIIIAGQKGEVSLWQLSESMSMNIKNVLEEMKINEKFWEQYEIKYDNMNDYKNEIVNNSDYAINNRKNRLISNNNQINQVQHDINFNSKTYRKNDVINSNMTNNYNSSNISSNQFRRTKNKNELERTSQSNSKKYFDENNINNIKERNQSYNENKYLNKSEYSNNNYNKYNYMASFKDNFKNNKNKINKTFSEDISNNNNNFNNNYKIDTEVTKRAPLLIDSRQLLIKKDKDKHYKKENFIEETNTYKNYNNNFKENYNKEKINNNYFNRKRSFDNDKNSNIDKINDKNNFNEISNYYYINNKPFNDIKNNNYEKFEKTIKNIEKYENNINENNDSKNKYNNISNENNDINGMNYKPQLKYDLERTNDIKNSPRFFNNKINTMDSSRTNINKTKYRPNFSLRTSNEKIQKLKHINLGSNNSSSNNNRFYRTQSTNHGNSKILNYSIGNNNLLFSKDKNEEERQKNIRRAINELLNNNSPFRTLEKEKNIQITIKNNQNEEKILNRNNFKEERNQNYKKKDFNIFNNIENYNNNNEDIENDTLNEINDDLLSNQKINDNKYINDNINNKKEEDMINSGIRIRFGINKKYPEPDDIDDNLITSHVEPIPDLENHNKVEKIDIHNINQIEKNNIDDKAIKEKNISKDNNIDKNSKISINKNVDIKEQSNNNDMYIKTRAIDDNFLIKSSDDEFIKNNELE